MNSKFVNEFENFLNQYALNHVQKEISSDNLNLFQSQVDDLYSQVENILPDSSKQLLLTLQECYLAEISESNRLYFLSGFKKAIELNLYLNKNHNLL